MAKVYTYIDQTPQHYGLQLVQTVASECFQQCPGIMGLNEFQFYLLWRNQRHTGQPVTNSTFAHYANVHALIKRMADAADVIHPDVQCISCDQQPIQGLRFKCASCRKLSLCFDCFCSGFSSRKHERTHRMYEISTNVSKTRICTQN